MAVALAVVGGLVSAIGSLAAGQAAANTAEYNAEVAKRNASAVSAETFLAMEDQRRENRRNLGTIKAAYGQNNLLMAGSTIDVLQDAAVEGEWDVAKTRFQGNLKAQGYREEAALFKMEAKNDIMAGFIGAGTSLLGGFKGAFGSTAGQSLLAV